MLLMRMENGKELVAVGEGVAVIAVLEVERVELVSWNNSRPGTKTSVETDKRVQSETFMVVSFKTYTALRNIRLIRLKTI